MSNDSLDAIRHSLAHLLAAAVKKRYPKAKLGVGPVIERGFYYDFKDADLTDKDLESLEKEMRKLAAQNLPFKKELWAAAKAASHFRKEQQPFKLELIKDISKETKGGKVGMMSTGGVFLDLCRGGHVKNTGDIPLDAFKLTRVAGAYWKGKEKNPMLTRVYGVAFAAKEELESHLRAQEEAVKRDHRRLGKELGLFTIAEEVGPGLPLFYPKGAVLRRIVEDYIESLQEKSGYEPIWIPHIAKGELYRISGHLNKYDAMFPAMKLKGEADYYLKPMNCPHFMMLYKSLPHSFRDLPVRWTSTTTNYRYEKSGELSGLTRVRALTQDDCHVFLRDDQIEDEVGRMLDMVETMHARFGFEDFWVRISTRDPKDKATYIGRDSVWKESERILSKLVELRGWKHEVGKGEAAFYGPKLDFIFRDVLGREWQLSTIQLDMNLPSRFNLEYIDETGKKKEPVVLHRAILGSTERFMGILIEHFAGAFPLWLSPEQVRILPVSDKFTAYANELKAELQKTLPSLRVDVGDENETLGKKIREGETMKIPYLVIVGEKEQAANTLSPRKRGKGDLGAMSREDFLSLLAKELQ